MEKKNIIEFFYNLNEEDKNTLTKLLVGEYERQNKLLTTVNYISSILLQSSGESIDNDIVFAMKIIGEEANVDRVYVWENYFDGKELCAKQDYEWVNGVEAQQGKEFTLRVSYKDVMADWLLQLSEGLSINGLTKYMKSEKATLEEQGVLSVLVVPIFLKEQFWGFVGFDDCRNERVFTTIEEKILRSASELIGNVIIRRNMERSIYHDPLTGIYNRRFFDEQIERVIGTLSRSGGALLSVLMIDIDFFKKFNDKYGHLDGDECLKKVAQVLQNSMMRQDDFVARYGGEEFVVVLPNTDETGAKMVTKRIVENVWNCNILHEDSPIYKRVTISVGVAGGRTTHPLTARDFIHLADNMLYESKKNGRNQYTFMKLGE
jgi:diguanylate cyclase (GGDEF)-like protein